MRNLFRNGEMDSLLESCARNALESIAGDPPLGINSAEGYPAGRQNHLPQVADPEKSNSATSG
jgi:hypothetical protein